MKQFPREFLKDLSALLEKYGPEPFQDLVEYLNNPEYIVMVKAALIELSAVAQTLKKRKTKPKLAKKRELSSGQHFEPILELLYKTDPEKANILSNLNKGLKNRELLHTSNELKNFCHVLGLSVQSKAQRRNLIIALLQYLAELPLEKVKTLADKMATLSLDSGKEYHLLVNAILGESKKG
jgi:hypothetical protein